MSYNYEARKVLFEEAAIQKGYSIDKDQWDLYKDHYVSEAWDIFNLIELDDI
jgi:hypothetical protein